MNFKVALNWVWFAACVLSGLVLLNKNLDASEANIWNWSIVVLMFTGAYYFYRRAEQISPST